MMSLRSTSVSRRWFCYATVLAAGALPMLGCGGNETAPVGTPGAAPVDNDAAARQKEMEDFMNKEAAAKKK